MPKHSSKMLLAHQLQLQAIILQLDALALSHPSMKQAFGMAVTMLQTVKLPAAGTTVAEVKAAAAAAGPKTPFGAPEELPPAESYDAPQEEEDDFTGQAGAASPASAPHPLRPEELS